MDTFFSSDLFRFSAPLLGIIISCCVIIARLEVRNIGSVLEVITMVTFGIGGFSSIVSACVHFFAPDMVASSIGWPLGSPFQMEVAGANLAIGLIGFGCFWRRSFWLPYVISKTAFLWTAGVTHLLDLLEHQNLAPRNAGATLYLDFVTPMICIGLLWLTARYGDRAPEGFEYRRPRI